MGLVLLDGVATFSDFSQCSFDLWNELLEFKQWKHSLRTDLSDEVSASRTKSLDEIDEASEALLNRSLLVKLRAFVLQMSIIFIQEEREGHETRGQEQDAEDGQVLLIFLTFADV